MKPSTVAQNRTARLAREATTPVYSTSTPSPEKVRADRLRKAEDAACTEDFCFVCSRATDHWGEHTPDQILAWTTTRWGKVLMR